MTRRETEPPEHRNSLVYVISQRGVGQAQAMIVWGRSADGTRVSINEATRGAAEHLKCECGADFVARKGEKNAHHFAHASGGAEACRKAQVDALCHFAADALGTGSTLRLPLLRGKQRTTTVETVKIQVVGDYSGVCMTSAKGELRREMAVVFTIKHRQPPPSMDQFKAMGMSAISIDLAPHRNQADEKITEAIRSEADRCWIYNARFPDVASGQAKSLRRSYLA